MLVDVGHELAEAFFPSIDAGFPGPAWDSFQATRAVGIHSTAVVARTLVGDPESKPVVVQNVLLGNASITPRLDVKLEQSEPELPRRGRLLDKSHIESASEIDANFRGQVEVNFAWQTWSPALATQLTPKLVELLAKLFVVCPKRLDHVPHRLECRTIQGSLGVCVGVDEHGDDDGADGLVRRTCGSRGQPPGRCPPLIDGGR